jgi:hypothetical protein
VRIDTESFRTHGDFALGLLASDTGGSSILDSRASASE